MADDEFNIYYQYNCENEINHPEELNNKIYFLIECQKSSKDSINYKKMMKVITDDGVDLGNVKTIYARENDDNHGIVLKTLSKNNFNVYEKKKNIYLHFLIEEDACSQKNLIKTEIEKYQKQISELNDKYKNISEEMKKIKNSNLLSEKTISEIIKKQETESPKKNKLFNSINSSMLLRSSISGINRGRKEVYILYLFGSIFDIKSLNYEENDYFEEMKQIYMIYKQNQNNLAKLVFEPLINLNNNNFKDYFENPPDVLHININSNYLNEELIYNNLGETINTNFEAILKKLGNLEELSSVKLLILSSDKQGKISRYFKSIKNIIKADDLKKKKNENKTFYQTFYSNILKGCSLKQAFDKANHINFSFDICDNTEVYICPPSTYRNYEGYEDNIQLNDNCALKLDFVKYNYHQIFGRNIQIKLCIEKIQEKIRNILVYGGSGAGKKSFVQLVGKYFFERKNFTNIEYIEFYDLYDIEEGLTNRIEEIIKLKTTTLDNESTSDHQKMILLIINFKFVINNVMNLRNVEEAIDNNKNKYRNIYFLYTYTTEQINIEKLNLNKTSIKLEKIRKNKEVLSLLNDIIEEYLVMEKSNSKIFTKLKRISEYPNYFFLEALYFKKFGTEKEVKKRYESNNSISSSELLNDFINRTKEEYKLNKILPLFYIQKLGIRDDILNIFFKDSEIEIIKTNLNYLIEVEEDSKGNNYLLDGYFIRLLDDKFKKDPKNTKELYKNNLIIIFENYAKIFRYIVNFSDFSYNLTQEFHAGINQGFWFSLYLSNFKEKYNKFVEKMNKKRIYFDQIRYFNNIKYILEERKYIEIIKENIKNFKEYISQILICVPTILYFDGNSQLMKKILDIFEGLISEVKSDIDNWDKDILRLKIFRYWSSKNSTDLTGDEFIKKHLSSKEKMNNSDLDDEMKFEISLIKIYNMIQENIEYESINCPSFEECQAFSKNDNLNLVRLNVLYGILKKYEKKEYFLEAYNLAEKMNDKSLKKAILVELAEYYLKHSEFDEFNKVISQYEENNDKKNTLDNKFEDLEKRITRLKNKKDEDYKNYIKNKLFFYTSEPFFYEDDYDDSEDGEQLIPLQTESNNSFYLKYNLKLKMPKDMEICFESINSDFLNVLENRFQNPSKFIYIGSDYFSKNGELFYSDNENMKAVHIPLKDLEKKIEKFKNKTDMLILGFINSEVFAEYFLKNHFPNVIYLSKSNKLSSLLKKPYFYFYFQRCFFSFLINLILNLDKIPIKEAFIKANNTFMLELLKLKDIDNSISEDIQSLLQQGIINYKYEFWDEDKILFDELNISRSSSFANNNLNINNIINTINLEENNKTKVSICEKKSGKITDFSEINIKFEEDLNDSILEFLINKRYYGNKEILSNVINKIKQKRIINIYGKSDSGKSILCIELCKYFYMNKLFKKGIYYISNINKKKWEKKDELKDLKNKQKNNQNNELNDILIILDDKNNLNDCMNYIYNSNSYFIIVTRESIHEFSNKISLSKSGRNKSKRKKQDIQNLSEKFINDIECININRPLSLNFKEEFIYYMRITLFVLNESESNKAKKLDEKCAKSLDSLMRKEEEVYINDIIEVIQNILE